MSIIQFLRNIIPERSPVRLAYHKLCAIAVTIWYRFPSQRLKVIAVTGTSGKSSTVTMIQSLLRACGKKVGSISTIQINIDDQVLPNQSLRTTLRPSETQKLLRKMVSQKCEYAVIEVSSHAIDQNRLWGIAIDTVVLTNISDHEHLDYHENFSDYIRTKKKLFQSLNAQYRKPNVDKTIILNADDQHFAYFNEVLSDKKWTYARKKNGNIKSSDTEYTNKNTSFTLNLPNNVLRATSPFIGAYNLENTLAAITVCVSEGIAPETIANSLQKMGKIPGRLEYIQGNLPTDPTVIVDFSYKPSSFAVLFDTLRKLTNGRIVVVWGGAGGRAPENWHESAKILDANADEIILTTDDPGNIPPKDIATEIKKYINRTEGDRFFDIPDRYEAIRYAILTAEPNDLVLIAGRGHEAIQKIGKVEIPFDDRVIAKEILDNN
ncbi:hypothetical protein CSB37_01615 [bacterium DOLZORAL124_38_8]|nr:MAG: hypothetical protein CSB37_01615 [bacterium DOLZORAL124_38_8]